jgi:hypothetical protein
VKQTAIALSLLAEVFLLLFLIPKVETGDLISYKNLFNIYEHFSIGEFIDLDAATIIGSRDYGFNFLVFIFSKIANFETFIFCISIFYFISILILLIKKNLYYLIILLPFSFYMVGIQFSAIRLEIALSIFIFFYFSNKKYLKYVSIFFHTQIIPIFLSQENKIHLKFVFFGVFFLTILLFYNPHIIEKFLLYSKENSEISKNYLREYGLILFSIFVVSISKRKIDYYYIILALILITLVYILGAGRINIIVFYLMLLNIKNCNNNILLIISLTTFFLYDIYKGLYFIDGIIIGNSGFDSIKNIF